MTNLLVASAGGHLQQLSQLLPRLGIAREEVVWVTYDLQQSRTLLAGERRVAAHHPTTKNLPNAIRNYRLARQFFYEHDIERVISTGAAVAVPFILRGRQLGIPCHYIESATRVEGPSLSGHMLELLRGVRLYRQMGEWSAPRWERGPCVFDGCAVVSAPRRSIRRVVVSLGTHGFPFTALIERLAPFLRDLDAEVVWQLGSTPPPDDLSGDLHAMLPPDGLQKAISDADVVIGHAGVGLTLTCLQAGKVPVLVPRRRARREHTDDHQSQLAWELERQGLAVVAEVGELSREHLERAAALAATYDEPPPFELVD